ncbi:MULTISPECIES: hypothetical protein [unclassified Kitasatospora]|uniref:hypothetical protein n=1 Tax=unclassified Kitasatospora TaxID=2633591 RepID=UPI0033E81667
MLIRQPDALAEIMAETRNEQQRQVLLDQAGMIERLSRESVAEPADREDVRRRYLAVLAAHEQGRRTDRSA